MITYIYKSATEIITPTIYADGTAITAYTINGNTLPGVGVRTENLFDESKAIDDKFIDPDGNEQDGIYDTYNFSYVYLPVTPNTVYTLHYEWTVEHDDDASTYRSTHRRIIAYDSDGNYISQIIDIQPSRTGRYGEGTFTTPSNCYKITINYINKEKSNYDYNIMLNTGSTAKPYEPYGYKIPISNGQQTIDIYIGDLPLLKSLDGTAVDDISNGTLTRRVDSDGSVLPTPTTTQITMPSIPTTEGANSITVDTTVQPSEFSATWTGWHDANVKEWDGSQWNE